MDLKPNLQTYLIDTVLSKFEKQAEGVAELSKLLDVQTNGIYRRMRNESNLTPDEIQKIALHFKISLDAHNFDHTDHIFFRFNPFIKKINNFEDYLEELHADLRGLTTLPNVKIHYASAEIPIFYYIAEPELFSFKLYVWGRSVWNFEYLQKEDFTLT